MLPFFLIFTIQSREVVITVDDLPFTKGSVMSSEQGLKINRDLLNVFKKHKIKGAYGFANMYLEDQYPDVTMSILKEWIDQGQGIGNHGYAHRPFNEMSIAEFQDEVIINQRLLERYDHMTSPRVFRFPHLQEGDTIKKKVHAARILEERGLVKAQVTLTFSDWRFEEPYKRCSGKDNSREEMEWLELTYLNRMELEFVEVDNFFVRRFCRTQPHLFLNHMTPFNVYMMDKVINLLKEKYQVNFIHGKKVFFNEDSLYRRLDVARVLEIDRQQNNRENLCHRSLLPKPSRPKRLKELQKSLGYSSKADYQKILKDLCRHK